MRRKKRPISRRRRAIIWLLLLIFLVAWAVLPGQYRFLPDQAIREAERMEGIGPTQVVMEIPEEEGRTLRANENGIMVSTLYHDPYIGWNLRDCSYLDCSKPDTFYVGFCTNNALWSSRKSTGWMNCYGRIPWEHKQVYNIDLFLYEDGEWTGTYTVPAIGQEWQAHEGFYYFVISFEKNSWAKDTVLQLELHCPGPETIVREFVWDYSTKEAHEVEVTHSHG